MVQPVSVVWQVELALDMGANHWGCDPHSRRVKWHDILKLCSLGVFRQSAALFCRGGIISAFLAIVTLEVSLSSAYFRGYE